MPDVPVRANPEKAQLPTDIDSAYFFRPPKIVFAEGIETPGQQRAALLNAINLLDEELADLEKKKVPLDKKADQANKALREHQVKINNRRTQQVHWRTALQAMLQEAVPDPPGHADYETSA